MKHDNEYCRCGHLVSDHAALNGHSHPGLTDTGACGCVFNRTQAAAHIATMDDCKRNWQALRDRAAQFSPVDVIARIDQIDRATPWAEAEPLWWLEMQDARRSLRAQMQGLAFIRDHIQRNNYAPTYEEIRRGLGCAGNDPEICEAGGFG